MVTNRANWLNFTSEAASSSGSHSEPESINDLRIERTRSSEDSGIHEAVLLARTHRLQGIEEPLSANAADFFTIKRAIGDRSEGPDTIRLLLQWTWDARLEEEES